MKSSKLFNLFGVLFLVLAMLTPAVSVPAAAAAPDGMDKVEALVLEQLAEKGQTDFLRLADREGGPEPGRVSFQPRLRRASSSSTRCAPRPTAPRRTCAATWMARVSTYTAFYIVNTILVQGGNEALLQRSRRGLTWPDHRQPPVPAAGAHHRRQPAHSTTASSPTSPSSRPTRRGPWATPARAPSWPATTPACTGTTRPSSTSTAAGTARCADHNYNWWDATGTYPNEPDDGHGHGTHTSRHHGRRRRRRQPDRHGARRPARPLQEHDQRRRRRRRHVHHLLPVGPGAVGPERREPAARPWPPTRSTTPGATGGGGQNQFRDAVDALQAAGIVGRSLGRQRRLRLPVAALPGDYQEVFTTGSVNHATPVPAR